MNTTNNSSLPLLSMVEVIEVLGLNSLCEAAIRADERRVVVDEICGNCISRMGIVIKGCPHKTQDFPCFFYPIRKAVEG